VDKDDPDILIIHGDADNVVPHCQSVNLKNAYDNAGPKPLLSLFPVADMVPDALTRSISRI
jgi:predicted esterase